MIRVLIVDDEPFARETLRCMLGNRTDFTVVGEASNGLEALTLVADKEPQLVFLDIAMPEMTGMEFLHALNELPHLRKPVVILTTAHDFMLALDVLMAKLLAGIQTWRFLRTRDY